MDGAFSRIGNMLADILILSLLWIVTSIPIFTIGASTTALFYVTTRRISNAEGYLVKDYFKSFKQNFKQATVIWVAIALIILLLFANLEIIKTFGELRKFMLPIYFFLMLEVLMLTIYIFPLISRFDLTYKEVLKNAFLMANRHFPTTIFCIMFIGILLLATELFLPLILVDIVIYAFSASYFLMRVFKKYRPEIDNINLEE